LVPKTNSTVCRLQIRLPSGQPIKAEFGANEPLSSVTLYIKSIQLMTKIYEKFSILFHFSKNLPTHDEFSSFCVICPQLGNHIAHKDFDIAIWVVVQYCLQSSIEIFFLHLFCVVCSCVLLS
ncbi:unnamed protein product, partial [Trichobilharzia regenti]